MERITVKKLEVLSNSKVKTNFISHGFDIASRTGFCYAKVTKKYISLDWNYIEFSKTKADKYKEMVYAFDSIMEDSKADINIIEDTYLKYFYQGRKKLPQVNVLKQLSRYGGMAISSSVRNEIPYKIIGATKARAALNIDTKGYGRGNSKRAVADWLRIQLGVNLKGDEDISDGIILALTGLLEKTK